MSADAGNSAKSERRRRTWPSAIGARNAQLDDADWLRRRYVEDRAPIAEIAAEAGSDLSTVHLALRRHGIPPRGAHRLRRAQIERWRAKGVGVAEMARRLEVDPAVLYDRLYRWGLQAPQAEGVDLVELRRRYEDEGWSVARLAAEHETSTRTVRRWLRAAGAQMRRRGRRSANT